MKKNNSLSECNGNTLSHKINNFSSSKNNNIMVIDDEIHHDGLPKKQLIKLILDSLDSMGYKESVKILEAESKVQLENDLLQNLKDFIISGKWDSVNKLLLNMNFSDNDLNKIKFCIAKQKYLELLDKENLKESLQILRNELVYLNNENETMQMLAYFLLLESKERYIQANWDNNIGKSRNAVYEEIYKILCKNQFVSRGRLHDLIKQALLYQESLCNTCQHYEYPINLFRDHHCSSKTLNWSTKQILYGHKGEVWGCKFSPNGKLLASYDSCGEVIIWTQGPDSNYVIYRKHMEENSSIYSIDWNLDNNRILFCTKRNAIVYGIEENSVLMKLKVHNTCTSCGWIPNKDEFLTSGIDGKLHHIQFITSFESHSESIGNESISNGVTSNNHENNSRNPILYTWSCDGFINDFSIKPDGKQIIAVDHKNNIVCFDIDTKQKLMSIPEKNLLVSCSLSNNMLLINSSSTSTPFIGSHTEQSLLIYDIEKKLLTAQLNGYKQFRYVIRSCFHGNQYVVSGSEDSLVYIWHLPTGKLVNKLVGHTSVVNSVTSNQNDGTFASCSDDGTLRVWTIS